MFYVTKTYDHSLGLSACFRQWRAQSHCRFLHGYALSITLKFGAETLNENNWVIDFGGLKPIKAWICDTFDHKLIVAENDPMLAVFTAFDDPAPEGTKIVDMVVIPFVGCEGFAKYVFDHVSDWLGDEGHAPRVFLHSVEVREHGGNSATYQNENVK